MEALSCFGGFQFISKEGSDIECGLRNVPCHYCGGPCGFFAEDFTEGILQAQGKYHQQHDDIYLPPLIGAYTTSKHEGDDAGQEQDYTFCDQEGVPAWHFEA